ncbi:PEP-CTERM sorting domain-containing protein [Psychromonas sp. MME2]|uniref:PEP-CTERM sorting domain-containing protein n=1 Tax=unclassified Psychromonas TaxID=2614957 RepID=UPI00339C1B9B
MKKFLSLLSIALVLLFTASSASAMLIQGEISFTGNATTTAAGGVVTSVDFGTFNVDVIKGNFIPYVSTGAVATFTDLATVAATNSLWTAGGFTFDLNNVLYNSVDYGAAVIAGTGFISGNGYDSTAFKWLFTSQVGESKTFSATVVPAPAGAALLGLAILGFGLTRRNKRA